MEPALDSLPCGVVAFGDDGCVLAANRTLLAMLGYERDEVLGQHVERLMGIPGRIFFQTHVYPLARLHGSANELFVLFRHKDGTDVGALLNVVREDVDGTGRTVGVVLEVRERRKFEDALLRAKQAAEAAQHALEAQNVQMQEQAAELELQAEELNVMNEELLQRSEEVNLARQVAEEASRAKSLFLTTMSHELRTPLNAIGGYAQLLEMGVHGPVTETQRETLDRIVRSQRHLLRLINDILNLARIESGRIEYELVDVSLRQLVSAVLPMVEPQLSRAELALDADIPQDLVARADIDKAQQILINLLGNASKFTPARGRVSLRARRDGNLVLLTITDTGIGIPQEKLTGIFEPFVQVDTEHTRRHEGTGLGLAISRDLARGMGGDLHATSEVGSGSSFTLSLPSAAPDAT